jgi:GNAT superfamily N-acetyltransferase
VSSSPPDADLVRVAVRTTWLELTDPTRIRPGRTPPPGVVVERAVHPSPELSRYLYCSVGGDWYWRDRLLWTWHQWLAFVNRDGFETWYLTVDGTPAGYCELDATAPPAVEIAAFGLLPQFAGRGLGGWFLEVGLRRALALGSRVWLHTCTLDGPVALANYQARGLVPIRVDEATVALAPAPPGPWPGAARPLEGGSHGSR